MKHIYIILALMLMSIMPAAAQMPALASPVNLGIVLVENADLDYMKTTCRNYQLTESAPEGDYTVFTSPDGFKVRMRMIPASDNTLTPEVEIISQKRLSDVKKILLNARYRKTGKNTYTKGIPAAQRATLCTQPTPTSLRFTKTQRAQ